MIEVLVGSAVFLAVALAAYGSIVSLFKLANASQANILAVQLADEQFEIIRNMPYTSVGLTNGIPEGILPQTQTLVRGGFTFTVGMTIRAVNLSTSTVQASDKIVEINVVCSTCQNFHPVVLTGQVSPANLQSASNGGALVIQAFDANGQPVQGANVAVQSTATSSIDDNDVTNNSGALQIIGVPQGVNAYQVIVSKSGYSTDRTYAAGGSNPTPVKPNLTVLNQQATQASFYIDRLSSFHVTSVTPLCQAVPNFPFTLVGSKQIGASVPKYSQNLTTNGSGSLDLNNMEWDTYTLTPTGSSYDLAGLNPYNPIVLNPNNFQNIQIVLLPKNSNSPLVTVEDGSTKLPISNASVELTGPNGFDVTYTTGQGSMSQTDWSGGSGQAAMGTANRYWADNSFADGLTSPGDIILKQAFGLYNVNATGTIESSTFDTGTSSNFYTFSWTPVGQPALAGQSSVKFQFATNPTSTSTVWSYLGPDGTPNTYYSVSGSPINAAHNGNEFARYMAYLTTNTATVTPDVSGVSFTYTSSCVPPGQVLFQGLQSGNYTVNVIKSGYAPSNQSLTISSGWQQATVLMGQ